MTNYECRRNDKIRMTKSALRLLLRYLVIRASFVIRHSCFVIFLTPLHLPVFDELVRDFFQETRRPLKDIAVSAAQPHVRISEIKFVARA